MALYGGTRLSDVKYLINEFSKANMIIGCRECDVEDLSNNFLTYISREYYNFHANWSCVGYFKKRDLILEFIEIGGSNVRIK